jgi:hypothetical protein
MSCARLFCTDPSSLPTAAVPRSTTFPRHALPYRMVQAVRPEPLRVNAGRARGLPHPVLAGQVIDPGKLPLAVEQAAHQSSTGSKSSSGIGGNASSSGERFASTASRDLGSAGSMIKRSPSLRMMASLPGNSNSRGIVTAWFRPFLNRLTRRSLTAPRLLRQSSQCMLGERNFLPRQTDAGYQWVRDLLFELPAAPSAGSLRPIPVGGAASRGSAGSSQRPRQASHHRAGMAGRACYSRTM